MVRDPDPDGHPSAIRTYLECLRTMPDCTHQLVLQDDVELCRAFVERAEAAVRERPGDVIAFFVPGLGLHGKRMKDAAKAGESWAALPSSTNWAPAVATCWPMELAQDFLAYATEHVDRRRARRMDTTGDDPVIGAWKKARKLTIWATVPSLVEHPDVGYSLVKRREYKGTNPSRRAAVFTRD